MLRHLIAGATAMALLAPTASEARRVKASPRRIFGAQAYGVLRAATGAEVVLLERRSHGSFRGLQGLAAVADKHPSKRWLRRLRALLFSPRSYYRRRCELKGTCGLRCKTTPRAVIFLEAAQRHAVAVITVCHNLQAGPSVSALGKQVSMEPAEVHLLKLLLELFPDDAKLKQELLDAKEAARAR